LVNQTRLIIGVYRCLFLCVGMIWNVSAIEQKLTSENLRLTAEDDTWIKLVINMIYIGFPSNS